MTGEPSPEDVNGAGGPFELDNPFDLGEDGSADILVMDDEPSEAKRFGFLAKVLGYNTLVLGRLSDIQRSIMAVERKVRPRPKLIVMDLNWKFEYATFEQLGHENIKVPTEHLRGLVMLSEILSKNPVLAGIPSLLLSSYLGGEHDADYRHGLDALRQRGVKVEAVAKIDLRDRGGLECVATALERVGVDLLRTDAERPRPTPVGQVVTRDRLERAVDVLANGLGVKPEDLRKAWLADLSDDNQAVADRFERARLAFKILLAAKTVSPPEVYESVLDELDIIVPGVTIRDALLNAHVRSMRLLAAAFERRVGGPL